MRSASRGIGIGAITVSALIVVGGTHVGLDGLDAAAPVAIGLAGLSAVATSILAPRLTTRAAARVRTGAHARRLGGPRVF